MAMTVSVPSRTMLISVPTQERVCINCKHYKRYLWEADVPGESYKKLLISGTGYCLKRGRRRGALQKPCKDFETENGQ